MAWRNNPLSTLHWRRWGDDWVVFDAASGMTHRLDTLSATTLLLLQEQSADHTELSARLDEELQIGSDANLPPTLAAVLDRLEAASLIQQVRPESR
ncbi:MAG: HPr-rel-A system PqqD family peptide chaperone [Pseudomonadota bacterium]|nr:HPr-rel-A system PqqD family peptide chaperone [Pseudomonadota bacterium]